MAALEVIREIVGFGEGLVGRLVMLDARAMRFETLTLRLGPGQSAVRRAADDPRFVGARLEHDPAHALGLDPGVDFRFSEKIMLQLSLRSHSVGSLR
jgi:hypothetical protein